MQSFYEEIRHSEHKIPVVLFMLPQETMFSIECSLYTLNPKCKPWAYIQRGFTFGRVFRLVYKGAYIWELIFGGLIFGILQYINI